MLDALLRASWQGGAYALAVWVACALLPRLPAGARALLWWLVSLKFVIALAGPAPVPVPILPPVPRANSIVEAAGTAVAPLPAARAHVDLLTPVLLSGWGLLVSAGLWSLLRDLRLARRLRRSVSAPPEAALATFERLRWRLRVRTPVRLAFSPELAAPLVLGPWRPLVVLPSKPSALQEEAELEMALAHELLHVRRRDLWLAAVPRLAALLFPFHPLARLAAREERLCREAACDAAVLRALGRAPREYGQLLLRFGVVPASPGAAQGAPTFRSLRRRLQMLDHVDRSPARVLACVCLVLAALALVPFTTVARPQGDPDDSLPATTELDSEREVDVDVDADVDADVHFGSAQDSNEAFIVSRGENATMFSSSDKDFTVWKRLTRSDGGDLFYFRQGEKAWVSRDPSVLADVQRLLAPLQELGDKQGKLGEQQGRIGEKQGLLGEKQGELGARLGMLGGDGPEQDRLQGEMETLGSQMESLGREMDVLGREMDALGREMDEAGTKVRADLRRLAEDAIRRGAAQPLAW